MDDQISDDSNDESGTSSDEVYDNIDKDDDSTLYDPKTFLPSGPMSSSLMKALGLIPADAPEVGTDWKPPAQCGLEHSQRKLFYTGSHFCVIICLHIVLTAIIPKSQNRYK